MSTEEMIDAIEAAVSVLDCQRTISAQLVMIKLEAVWN